jgi:tetratricopeptide (TPR) repeat protein
MGDCAKALHFHEKALEIARTRTAPNNLFLAICHTNTGNAYLKMNQPARALLLYKEALEPTKITWKRSHV